MILVLLCEFTRQTQHLHQIHLLPSCLRSMRSMRSMRSGTGAAWCGTQKSESSPQ